MGSWKQFSKSQNVIVIMQISGRIFNSTYHIENKIVDWIICKKEKQTLEIILFVWLGDASLVFLSIQWEFLEGK